MTEEQNLKQSLSLLKAALQATADGILVVANDGRISEFNQQFAKMWGLPESVLKLHDDRKALDFVMGQLREPMQFMDKVRELYASPEATSFDVLVFKDGRVFERYSQPQMVDGRVVGRVWGFRDVTERRQAEEQANKLARELKTILDTLSVGVALVKNRRVQWANPAIGNILGYSHEEFVNLETIVTYANDDDYRRVGSEGYAQLVKGEAYVTEVEVQRKDGVCIWGSLIGRAINPANLAEGSIWMLQDITDRKQAEAELQGKSSQLETLTKNLEQRVEEEVALRMRNEQILVQQSKLAAMGETLGAVAHQWRQPLNSLGLIIQNLKDARAYGELNEVLLEQVVERSMSQIKHMSKTIDDFRNFFQPDKEKTVFETLRAAGEVLALLSAQLQANNISYRLVCHIHQQTFADFTDLVPCLETRVLGYRNEFEHVLLNLVNNARDAILESQALTGRPNQGVIGFDFHNRDGKVIVAVSDNGGGLDPRIVERLFEPYFTTKEQAKGSGLGLYMSKVIIEDHMGGTIAVANGEEGAVFTITLPRFEEEGAR